MSERYLPSKEQSLFRQLWAWFRLARPDQLLAVSTMMLTGVLQARFWFTDPVIDGQTFLWGWVALIPVAISIHYANEYADYETDQLTTRTLFSGGSGVLPSGIIPRQQVLYGAWGMLLFGLLVAVLGIGLGYLPVNLLVVLMLGAVGGWMYSLPPVKAAWHGWGEALNAFLGGMLLPIYGFVLIAGALNIWVVVINIPFMLMVFANLLATTWADGIADESVGKRTLATRFLPKTLCYFYLVAIVGSIVFLWVLSQYLQPIPSFNPLAILLLVPFLLWGFWSYTRIHSPHPTVIAMIVFMLGQILIWI